MAKISQKKLQKIIKKGGMNLSKIIELPDILANQIAAGEVVEGLVASLKN